MLRKLLSKLPSQYRRISNLFVRAEANRGATSRAEAARPVNDRAQDVVAALARADAAAAEAVSARAEAVHAKAEAAAARRAAAHAAKCPSCLDHAPACGWRAFTCGHISCATCASRVAASSHALCPFCRAAVKKMRRVFLLA